MQLRVYDDSAVINPHETGFMVHATARPMETDADQPYNSRPNAFM